MEIICHRGLWIKKEEQNTLNSFERAFTLGFGVETDIRDSNGELIISHDIPSGNEIKVMQLLQAYKNSGKSSALALNIKSDGLAKLLKNLVRNENIENYFCFDMSLPDTLTYMDNLNFFTRISEYEPINNLHYYSNGFWVDNFKDGELNVDVIQDLMKTKKYICLVSPELHGYNENSFWQKLKEIKYDKIGICTDKPIEANNFFND